MRKRILTFLLASAVLSTACEKKSYSIKNKADQSTDTQVLTAGHAPSEYTPAKALSPEQDADSIENRRVTNETVRPKNRYDIEARLDTKTHTLHVNQTLSYVNNTGNSLREIYFNIIPEAFSEKDDETSKAGGVSIIRVTVDGKDASLSQVLGTVYTLPLPEELTGNGNITIEMEYTVSIPQIADRFGYSGNTYNLGNVLITPALFENGKWLCQTYTDIGDAFYTEISDYYVKIDVPEGYQVAATGTLINGTYVAEDVRDFAFTASDGMSRLVEEHEDIALNVYYPEGCAIVAQKIMETAKKSMTLYNDLLGIYPYDTLNLVLTTMPGGIGGMEYPGMVMLRIDPEEWNNNRDYAENTLILSTTHEIAHQWFYGIVGNDEVRYPWLDEGMCRFLEGYYCDYYDEGPEEYTLFEMFRNEDQGVYDVYNGILDSDYAIDLNDPLYAYHFHPETYGEMYYKGAALIWHMYSQMGSVAFDEALKDYVRTFAYTEVTPEEFVYFWCGKGDFAEMFDIYLTDF